MFVGNDLYVRKKYATDQTIVVKNANSLNANDVVSKFDSDAGGVVSPLLSDVIFEVYQKAGLPINNNGVHLRPLKPTTKEAIRQAEQEVNTEEQPKPKEGESPLDYAERLTEWSKKNGERKEDKDNNGNKSTKDFKEEKAKRKKKNKLGVSEEEKDEALKKLRDMLLGKGENITAGLDLNTLLEQGGKLGVTVLQESELGTNEASTVHEKQETYETRDEKKVRFTSANPAAYGQGLPLAADRAANDGARPGDVQWEGDNLTRRRGGDLRTEEGEFCHVERVFRESGAFSFTAGERVENAADVAYIFSELEDASVENAFAVFVKGGQPTVVHLGVGNFTSTMVNQPTMRLAYERVQPDKVYFVHNHPSGNLKCSQQDVRQLTSVEQMLGTSVEGIIINLRSGKFGTFDTQSRHGTMTKPTQVEGEHPLKLYSFDKQVFSPDYAPGESLNGADKVAAFVSSHRLGDRKKLSFLVANNQLGVTANIHTPYTTIDDGSREKLASDMVRAMAEFGGTCAFVYGDFAEDKGRDAYAMLDDLNKAVWRLSGGTFGVMDIVKVEGNNTRSANDGDVFEPRAEYSGYTSEERDIIDRTKADGTYMKAPNGEPTKLNEKQ